MLGDDLARVSQTLVVESRHRIAVGAACVRTTLVRVTRLRRIAGGNDGGNHGASRTICVVCEKTVVSPEDWVKINDRLYHTRCWDRVEARQARKMK